MATFASSHLKLRPLTLTKPFNNPSQASDWHRSKASMPAARLIRVPIGEFSLLPSSIAMP
jgi:hypothetical protein